MVKRLSSKQEMQFDPDISLTNKNVPVAERRGNGLQNHEGWFKSNSELKSKFVT
jgi:hypothetical protein